MDAEREKYILGFLKKACLGNGLVRSPDWRWWCRAARFNPETPFVLPIAAAIRPSRCNYLLGQFQ